MSIYDSPRGNRAVERAFIRVIGSRRRTRRRSKTDPPGLIVFNDLPPSALSKHSCAGIEDWAAGA
jgi:hypothetical protein